jgi:hypothetical protein
MSSKKCRWASCTILTHTLRQLYEHCLFKKQIRVNLSKHAFCETFKTQYVIIMYYSCSTVTRKHANRVIDCRDVISGLQTHDIGANPIWHQIWHLLHNQKINSRRYQYRYFNIYEMKNLQERCKTTHADCISIHTKKRGRTRELTDLCRQLRTGLSAQRSAQLGALQIYLQLSRTRRKLRKICVRISQHTNNYHMLQPEIRLASAWDWDLENVRGMGLLRALCPHAMRTGIMPVPVHDHVWSFCIRNQNNACWYTKFNFFGIVTMSNWWLSLQKNHFTFTLEHCSNTVRHGWNYRLP